MGAKLNRFTLALVCAASAACMERPSIGQRSGGVTTPLAVDAVDAAAPEFALPVAGGAHPDEAWVETRDMNDASDAIGAGQDAGVIVISAGQDAGVVVPPDETAPCVTGKFCPVHEPDNDVCGTLDLVTAVKTELKRANMLVVFDRSGSMEAAWAGVPKYESAGKALTAAIAPVQAQLTVGGVFFPSPIVVNTAAQTQCPNGCDITNIDHWLPTGAGCCLAPLTDTCPVNAISEPDQIDFTTATTFMSTLPRLWSLNDPTASGGTPLERGIERAAEAIAKRTFTDKLMVFVITDGEPNCGTNERRVLEQVAKWHTAGIETYVIGLPGAQPAAEFLAMLAKAGGSDKYMDPKNPAELETRLRAVLSRAVRTGLSSCTIKLGAHAKDVDKLMLHITQDGKDKPVPAAEGRDASWQLNPAGDEITLGGELCKAAKAGTFDSLHFTFGCTSTPPSEPPIPTLPPD